VEARAAALPATIVRAPAADGAGCRARMYALTRAATASSLSPSSSLPPPRPPVAPRPAMGTTGTAASRRKRWRPAKAAASRLPATVPPLLTSRARLDPRPAAPSSASSWSAASGSTSPLRSTRSRAPGPLLSRRPANDEVGWAAALLPAGWHVAARSLKSSSSSLHGLWCSFFEAGGSCCSFTGGGPAGAAVGGVGGGPLATVAPNSVRGLGAGGEEEPSPARGTRPPG